MSTGKVPCWEAIGQLQPRGEEGGGHVGQAQRLHSQHHHHHRSYQSYQLAPPSYSSQGTPEVDLSEVGWVKTIIVNATEKIVPYWIANMCLCLCSVRLFNFNRPVIRIKMQA